MDQPDQPVSNPKESHNATTAQIAETKPLKTANGPPEVNVILQETKDLPEESVPLDDGQLPIDFLLLTVKDCEFLSCLSYMNPGFSRSYHDDTKDVYLGDMGKAKVAVKKCQMGPMGAIDAVKDTVKVLRPKAVFCVGFCGGLNTEKIKLGDVVVSEKLITYAPLKDTPGGIVERGVRVSLGNRLASLILHVGDGWKVPLKNPRELEVKICRGTLLSGPEVVDSDKRRDELTNRFRDGIAIEMEGEGVFAAAQNLNVEWIIIKGVSDYADGSKSKTSSWRPFASLMAASLTAHILSNRVVWQNWPHYGDGNTAKVPIFPALSGSSVEKQPSTVKQKGTSTCSRASSTERKNLVFKEGSPSWDELEKLSKSLTDWKSLARRLGFNAGAITGFDEDNKEYAKKALQMLFKWKQKNGLDATYEVLYRALCHELYQDKELAEGFCCISD